MIYRREFIAAVGFGLITVPLMIRAQQPAKVRRIGCILATSLATAETEGVTTAMVEGLRSLGWIEGQNLMIEWRSAENKYELYEKLARELVALKVDLIVTASVNAVTAAKNATDSIPIVMVAAADPVKFGLIASLAGVGRTATVDDLAARVQTRRSLKGQPRPVAHHSNAAIEGGLPAATVCQRAPLGLSSCLKGFLSLLAIFVGCGLPLVLR